jgi:hypothetical protein
MVKMINSHRIKNIQLNVSVVGRLSYLEEVVAAVLHLLRSAPRRKGGLLLRLFMGDGRLSGRCRGDGELSRLLRNGLRSWSRVTSCGLGRSISRGFSCSGFLCSSRGFCTPAFFSSSMAS